MLEAREYAKYVALHLRHELENDELKLLESVMLGAMQDGRLEMLQATDKAIISNGAPGYWQRVSLQLSARYRLEC